MVNYRFIAFAGLAVALPLNINLGAYSPALVVGDGEISFGGAAAAPAAAAAAASPAAVTAAAAETPVAAQAAASADPILSAQAEQIAALQGMGKEIAPRVDTDAPEVAKRDLAGFDRALQYAEVALTKGPKIELGTGGEGSGVGIIVDNRPAAAGAAAAEKRDVVDETSAPKRRSRVTTMYVRRGVPASLQSSSNEVVAREIPSTAQPAVPVSRRDAIDAVNLNVDGNEGVTLTFVETVDDGDAE
ncbi:hypothetical protein B0T22DRAFT_482018 [Podospora appendiculata]|uniref:Uncharacterized protein n=1 Tax=Podospora appendiculata TaxID=314037 RepID=A0AAE0X4J5_9PEZI|nr:hypothetical protein B0T22DRAFT_482018 [Podospora appendiculata]